MSISRVKTWVAAEVLTAADLNAEFDNPIDSALNLISPLTGDLNFNNNNATNLLLEVQSSTQSSANAGRIYYQSTQDVIHIDTGSQIREVHDHWNGIAASRVFG